MWGIPSVTIISGNVPKNLLEGFSRCDITAMFFYHQQTKGAFRTTWSLQWQIQLYDHALMNIPISHEGGLRVAKLKSTLSQQIHPLMAGSVTVSEGTVVTALPLPGLRLFRCFVLFSTLSTAAPHPPDSQLREVTPEILKLETVLSRKVHISCLSTLQILRRKNLRYPGHRKVRERERWGLDIEEWNGG